MSQNLDSKQRSAYEAGQAHATVERILRKRQTRTLDLCVLFLRYHEWPKRMATSDT